MQLRLLRSQRDQKGIFGGHKGVNFSLNYRLDVSDEERSLIDHYKVGDFIVHKFQRGFINNEPYMIEIQVMELVNGSTLEMRDFDEIVESEKAIVAGASNLKALLAQMRKFGGEEIIEI